MTIKVLFTAQEGQWDNYQAPLNDAFAAADLDVDLALDHPPAEVDYIVYAPNEGLSDFTPFTRCKAVLSLWAGVERIVTNETLTQPLAKMVNPGLTKGMVEWVTGHALRHHLGMDAHILDQTGTWAPKPPPLAGDRAVTVLGLGTLGTACASALAQIGFPVSGWSRSPKEIQGVSCYHGPDGLTAALTGAQIVILLLPDTAATDNMLNAKTLALLAPGAFVLNPGRGPLIDDDALLAALETGQIGHATLDVFRVEPLPVDHPYWAHPRVTVTPHIAAETRPDTAARQIAENIAGVEAGKPLCHRVDRDAGY